MVLGPLFSVREYSHRYLCDGMEITVITDIPVHLYMRWTTVEPLVHIVPVYRRGIFMHGETYFCFVAYHDNEQEEAGDTLTHTFIKRGWPICQTRYFYFWGSEAGIVSRSTTAYWQIHFDILSQTFICLPNNRSIHQTNVSWPIAHGAATGTVLDAYDAPSYALHIGQELTITYHIYRNYLFFATHSLPPQALRGEAYLDIWVRNHWRTSSVVYPNICITRGVQHDPVVATDYGDQLPYTTIGGQRDLATLIDNQYNRIHLNKDGTAFLSPIGTTRLCLRGEMDILDLVPPAGSNVVVLSSQQWPADKPPLLTVCYPPILPPPPPAYFYEPWGATLNQNNPWDILSDPTPPVITFSASIIKLDFTDTPHSGIISNVPADTIPLKFPSDQPLYLRTNNTEVNSINPFDNIGNMVVFRKNGQFIALYLMIKRSIVGFGSGDYGFQSAPPQDRAWLYIGAGLHTINMLDFFTRATIDLGIDPNPEGWFVTLIEIAHADPLHIFTSYLKNDYIALLNLTP